MDNATDRSSSHRDLRRAAAIILIFAIAGIGAGIAIEKGLLLDWQVVVLAPLGCVIALVWSLLLGARTRAPRETLDAGQNHGRKVVAVFAVLTLVTAGLLVGAPAGQEAAEETFMTGAFAVCAVLAVVFTGFASRDNDEFTRHLRARAARLGLMVAVPAMLVAVLAVRNRPALAADVLPLAIAMTAAIPALYFVFADWRASRDG